jgi:hypothetical protein
MAHKAAEVLANDLEAELQTIGTLPICPSWAYSAIRHAQRNMDFDVQEGFNEPDRQCGGSIAEIINMIPAVIAALRSEASK